ncbi:E3 ubiquitin-protein ligase RNF4-like isoform X2 [Triticum urartu]|nr:E3 ubiquitin-protein ligase RNF4-like isoform X2 [Triticum urartu]
MGTVGAWRRAQDGSVITGEAVVDLDRSPIAGDGGGGGQHEAPDTAGTRASPIDVEALGDEGRSRAKIKRRAVVVDLEADADQEGCGDARTFSCLSGNKRRKVPPVICLSPDREERSSNQQNSTVRVSRPTANASPKEPTFTCPVCLNKMELPSATSCGHVFCEKCIKAAIKAQKKCPT